MSGEMPTNKPGAVIGGITLFGDIAIALVASALAAACYEPVNETRYNVVVSHSWEQFFVP